MIPMALQSLFDPKRRKELQDAVRAGVPFSGRKILDEPLSSDPASTPSAANGRTLTPQEQQKLNKQLLRAAYFGQLDNVKKAIDGGADVNGADDDGKTALIWTSMYGMMSVSEFLNSKGADVNARCNNGRSALLEAAFKHQTSTVKFLVSKGANVNVKDNLGWTPLEWASQCRDEEIVDCLETHGAKK